jgi:hypothetical protein
VVINNNASTKENVQSPNQANAFYYYEDAKKNQFLGVVLSYFLPTAGHFYADDWGRGLPFLLAEVGGAVLMVQSVKDECVYSYSYYSYYDCYETRDEEKYNLGLTILLVAKIWEMFDANDAVKDYNRKLKRGLNLQVGLNPRRELIAGASYRF